MNYRKGFTLAEALITLTIVGVVAAIAVPSVTLNYRQVQYRTSLKKAIKTIDEAIALSIAKGERSAYYTTNLSEYLKKYMDVTNDRGNIWYTSDGMRFMVYADKNIVVANGDANTDNNMCGTRSLDTCFDNTTDKPCDRSPCIITVDVNGNRKPNQMTEDTGPIGDQFKILVTDKSAYPLGEVAQKAFYGSK